MKKILIIGATSAIASAAAKEWAKEGAEFFLVARSLDRLNSVAADLKVYGATLVESLAMDISDRGTHADMLSAALNVLYRIDVVLIAYGTLPDQSACEADAALAIVEFSTNCTSVIALLTILANHLEKQGGGAIAVITSVAGDRGRASNYLYGSAKSAVSTFCEGLRVRMHKSAVTVTDIRPGFIATPMTAGLPLPPLLVSQPQAVARRITSGIVAGKAVLYVPAFWWWIMFVIRSLPQLLFDRLKL